MLFVLDEFNMQVTTSSIGRVLRFHGWTKKKKKKNRRVGKGRNANLRDLYLYNSLNSGLAVTNGLDLDGQDSLPLVCCVWQLAWAVLRNRLINLIAIEILGALSAP